MTALDPRPSTGTFSPDPGAAPMVRQVLAQALPERVETSIGMLHSPLPFLVVGWWLPTRSVAASVMMR